MIQFLVYVLVEVENVPTVFMDEFGNQGNQAGLVRTMYKEDRAVRHGRNYIWGKAKIGVWGFIRSIIEIEQNSELKPGRSLSVCCCTIELI